MTTHNTPIYRAKLQKIFDIQNKETKKGAKSIAPFYN